MPELTSEQRAAIAQYHTASQNLTAALARVSVHLAANPNREPSWVLNQDLIAARADFRQAENEFELEFGYKPSAKVAS